MSQFQMVLTGIDNVPIVHCHIPRTGGMSVDYYFRKVFGDEHCVRLGSEADFNRMRNPRDPFYGFRWKYLSAHLPAREIMDMLGGKKFFMFTIVRDPVEREISAYKNIVEHSYAGHCADVRTFDDYLAFKERTQEKNLQCRYIQMGQGPARSVSAELLRYISAGHTILSVGKNFVLQEYMRAALGSSYVIEPHNVSKTRFELTEQQRRRLEPFIERDLELYELVCDAERTGDLLNDWRVSWRSFSPAPMRQGYVPHPHP